MQVYLSQTINKNSTYLKWVLTVLVSIMGTENDEKNGQTLKDDLSQTDNEQLNSCAPNTPYIPIEIGDNVIEGARQVLEVIRPTWSSDSIKFKVRIQII